MINYKVIKIKHIKDFKNDYIEDAEIAYKRFDFNYKKFLTSINSTRFYRYYNFFSLTVGSVLYAELFEKLKKQIRKLYPFKKNLWFESWINYQKQDEVLDWHDHPDCLFHGYLCIDPKKTETVFKTFKIDNEPGLLYIGPGNFKHKVNVLKPYNGYRITIAFNVIDHSTYCNMEDKYGNIDLNTGYIPI